MVESEIERRTITIDGTWDIETENWSKFVCGALYRPGYTTRVWSWRKETDFVSYLVGLTGTYWAHNGGRFDFLWLIGHLLRMGVPWRVSLSGSSVAALFVGEAIFRDSARLVPMSLEKGAAIGSIPKSKTSLPCDCEKPCGGYCSIKVGMPNRLLNPLIDYMVNDCKATYSMLASLADLCDRWDLDLRSTIGASAWATLRRQGVQAAWWGGKRKTHVTRDYTDARKAYYGGRTQVFRPYSDHGNSYDINSAYPAALASLSLPTGERRRVKGHEATKAFGRGDGIFSAVVHVPECFLPGLPVRGKHRIGFPYGKFRGWWTGIELQAAMSRGTLVRRIDEGLVWSTSEMVLAPFCRYVWGLRDKAGPKTALGTFLKLYANALTGKMASRPEVERIYSDPNALVFCPADFPCGGVLCGVGCCPHRPCTGKCGAVKPIAGDIPIFLRKYAQVSDHSHVEWSAYLTAFTRTQVLDFAGSGEDAVYCDTDSLKVEGTRTKNIGNELGQWKHEHAYQQFVGLAPKTYCYADEDGVCHGASKGIPDAIRNFHLLESGVTVNRGVDTFKSAVKRGEFFMRKSLTRRIRPDGIRFGDRVLRADGRTYPQTVKAVNDDFWEFG